MSEDLQRTVIEQAAKIRILEAQEEKTAIAAALGGALDAAGLELVASGRDQLARILGDQLALVSDGKGGRVVMAPGGASVNDWIRSTMATPEFSHFARGGRGPAAVSASSTVGTEVLGESLSGLIIREFQADKASKRPSGIIGDPARPFGLGRK
jgi:hypothetical protein